VAGEPVTVTLCGGPTNHAKNMNKFIRPPVSYPTTVVFVDDNDNYLDALRRFFPDVSTNLFFSRPQAGLFE
jgi:hypothetical protein